LGKERKHANAKHKRIIMVLLLTAGLTLAAVGCRTAKESRAEQKEGRVNLEQLSAPARATVDKVTAWGHVDQIDKEVEGGKVVYDVEATVNAKHVEFLIADADGAVLSTENLIDFGQLPEPVREAAGKYFGSNTGLKAMKGLEYGETHYEIEGLKNGKTVEVTFEPDGKIGK
jgi:uncharacterized membrane protein YkoI